MGGRASVAVALLALLLPAAANAKPKPYDFDGDGRQDLVVGWPGWSGPSADVFYAGAVLVAAGSPSGVASDATLLHAPDPHEADEFGAALASGDFDGDGSPDLAVASPFANDYAGAVTVMRGSDKGLRQGDAYELPGSEQGRTFGAALTAADFNRDGFDDLAVGAPGLSGLPGGSVTVVFGGADGLGAGTSRTIASTGGAQRFGTVLAAGDVNGDGNLDLVEAAPGVPAYDDPGEDAIVHAFYCPGTPDGPTGCRPMRGGASSLAVADVNGDGRADVIQGARRVKNDPVVDSEYRSAPWVQIRPGTPHGPGKAITITPKTKGARGVGDGVAYRYDESTHVFGETVAAGRLDGDRFADIVLSVPEFRDGRVLVLRGGPHGIARHGRRVLVSDYQNRNAIERTSRFGQDLSLLDLTGDGRKDLAAALPTASRRDCGCTASSVSVFRGGRHMFRRLPTRTVDLDALGIPQQFSEANLFTLGRVGSSR